VKGSKKLLSKSSKPPSSTISSPPKAAIAGSSAKKDEAQRRRNPLNDILRRRSGDDTVAGSAPPNQNVERETSRPSEEPAEVGARMAERIAELEKALSIAREEQHSMREELDKAKQLRHTEKDTPGDAPRQLGHTQPEATSSPVDAIIERIRGAEDKDDASSMSAHPSHPDHSTDDLLRQNYDLRHRLAQLEDRLGSHDYIHNTPSAPTTSHRDVEWNDLRSRLHTTEKESNERLQQLLSLKSSISSLTRTDAQITDNELSDSFTQLFNRIREWVISNFRRSKMDAANLPVETVKALKLLTPKWESIEKSDRLALFQALVTSAMMPVLEEPMIVGSHTGSLADLRTFSQSIEDTGTEYREWRRATVRAIERSANKTALEQEKSDVLHKIVGEIAHMLFTLTSINLTPTAKAGLMGILNAAVDLQRTIVLQKARYQVLFFRHQESSAFDETRMESVNDLDSAMEDDCDMLDDHRFLFCVFPCIEKFGDEWGENLSISNILLKAKVCCVT
jgi:hypothetical protein